jgi:dUTP pyrophosphatase
VDSDYRGEVSVVLLHLGGEPFVVERGLRLAQLVIAPVLRAEIAVSKKLVKTARGIKGFGSTGERAIDKRRKSRP